MRKKNLFIVLIMNMLTFSQAQLDLTHEMVTVSAFSSNPLLEKWETPYQTPPFDKIRTEDYLPAIEKAIEQARQDIRKIAEQKSEPTFENTIVALDRSGASLDKISNIFMNLLYCVSTPEMQELSLKINPMLAKFSSEIYLNIPLFQRVKQVYEKSENLGPAQRALLEKTYKAFVNSGANLSQKDKERFRQLTVELSTLTLNFGQNVLKYINSWQKQITDPKELDGIPELEMSLAKAKAKSKGMDGWVFDLSTPSYLAIMKYADNRELRKEFYLKFNAKAYGGEYDNTKNIIQILRKRNEMAQLLAYKTYADYVLRERMAENPSNVYQLLDELTKYSLPAAKNEITALQEFAKSIGMKEPIQRWDFTYYSEKQKKTLYDVSDEETKPYFELNNVIKGVLTLAGNLYDLQFKENFEIPVYHKDVKTYEVYCKDRLMAILYMDFFPRETKKEGAWMTSFREQYIDEQGKDVRPLISLVMNFTPSTAEQPSLLTFSEMRTFLHEFGHALHGILSEVPYKTISGTSVQRDFVELPSQIMENFATEPDFLNTFAFHYQTGESIPRQLIDKLIAADNYLAGYTSCRQLSFGYLDMMWHTTNPSEITNIAKMERTVMDKVEIMPVVDGTLMSTSFNHIFSGGYAAGYYGYKWAEVLDADAFSLFKEKGIFNPEVAESFKKNILSKGGSDKPMNLYVAFRGRKPSIDALLMRSGLK
jgi:peptidyl-dipeptidase Dcp